MAGGGSGLLAKHHTFLWAAFGSFVGLAVWRLMVRDRASRPALGLYLHAGAGPIRAELGGCHGASAQDGIGHSLHRLQLSGAQVAVTVKDRIKPVMPPLKQKPPAPDSEALVAYVRSLRE